MNLKDRGYSSHNISIQNQPIITNSSLQVRWLLSSPRGCRIFVRCLDLRLCVPSRQTAEHLGGDPSAVNRKKRQAPPPPNPFTGQVDREPAMQSTYDAEEDLSAQDLIDFSPVYRCLHIYTVVGARETFETYYRKQRKKQARLVLQPPTNMVGISCYDCWLKRDTN